jgi:alcohol dehydrogenase, propanol-preferring
MKAWVIEKTSDLKGENQPLTQTVLPKPIPGKGELLLKVKTCGVCHTEIDEIEGRTPPPTFPMVPGHQVVGTVEATKGKGKIKVGDRVGVAWIFSACGKCEYCQSGQENLCPDFVATGRDRNGGYAEYMTVPEKFAYPIPDYFNDVEAAPLLCAGAIGYRSLKLCQPEDGQHIGMTGFGASAHLVLKLILFLYPNSKIYVFARSEHEREFSLELGASWSGDTIDQPPVLLHSIIDTTPVWKPVIHALECLRPGGRLVINAIRKELHDTKYLEKLDYPKHLWMEKEIKSVANVTSQDVKEFIRIAAEMKFKPNTQTYPFSDANRAILDIKTRNIKGAKVLML